MSNIIFEPHFLLLLKSNFEKINVNVHSIPYGEYNEDTLKAKLSASNLIIVWLNIERLYPEILSSFNLQTKDHIVRLCGQLYPDLATDVHAKILRFSFEDCFTPIFKVIGHIPQFLIDEVNLKLMDTLGDQVLFIDLKHLIAEVGIANAYSPKGKYRWNTPYSQTLVEAAVKEIHKQYLVDKGITKKCLILDCDNVLWGGILSEDGIENLKLSGSGFGRFYQDFQRFVLSLYYHGVILAVCSKNDLSDVVTMFREHSEMFLKEEYIACFQVNWEDKPSNSRKLRRSSISALAA